MKSKPRCRSTNSLPIQPVLDDLTALRATFREVLKNYEADMEGRIAEVLAHVRAVGEEEEVLAERVRDLSDMLILLRSLEVKPAKGRRRDLKRIESLLADLIALSGSW